MSVVVAVAGPDGCAIGGDSRACYNDGSIASDAVEKIKVYRGLQHPYAIAACGRLGAAQRALDNLQPGPSSPHKLILSGELEETSSGLIVRREFFSGKGWELWSFAGDGSTVPHHRDKPVVKGGPAFACVGTGDSFAYGAILTALRYTPVRDPACLVRIGVEAATKYANTCGGKIRIHNLTKIF